MSKTALGGCALLAAMSVGAAMGAMAAQPHMENALSSLRTARAELVAASPNKGGHREKAMALIDQAIGETRAGMAFAAKR